MAWIREIHPAWNVITDECDDCGATRCEVDDSIVIVCEPVVGPHRYALRAIRRAQRYEEHMERWTRNAITLAENQIVRLPAEVQLHAAKAQALAESYAALAGEDSQPKAQPLVTAIRRLNVGD
jgi:hypothetical protein